MMSYFCDIWWPFFNILQCNMWSNRSGTVQWLSGRPDKTLWSTSLSQTWTFWISAQGKMWKSVVNIPVSQVKTTMCGIQETCLLQSYKAFTSVVENGRIAECGPKQTNRSVILTPCTRRVKGLLTARLYREAVMGIWVWSDFHSNLIRQTRFLEDFGFCQKKTYCQLSLIFVRHFQLSLIFVRNSDRNLGR